MAATTVTQIREIEDIVARTGRCGCGRQIGKVGVINHCGSCARLPRYCDCQPITPPRYTETWINGELKTIDLDAIWGETFAHWDCLVDSDTASEIATATERILRANA